MSMDSLLRASTPEIAHILDDALCGHAISEESALRLFHAQGRDLRALTAAADEVRREVVGDDVTYIVNRNINFTNVCVKTCKFCAFSRDLRSEQGYFLPVEEILSRVGQAVHYGATEVCVQAGLAPAVDVGHYVELTRAIRSVYPELHLHAFSPEEVKYGAKRSGISFREFITQLRDAGLGSLPGTSAEILDDSLRDVISPTRIRTGEWVEIITTAHELGVPTTATMMFGHAESLEQRVAHMSLLRDIQRRTGGFTEFVPLSFVHAESPLFAQNEDGSVMPGPTGNDILRLYAIARLFLGRDIRNLQASWVKEGGRVSQMLLDCGVNDLGGTLMNESISTAAGASNGQLMTPAALRRLIRDAGRVPVQRNTRYETVARFDDPSRDPKELLDGVVDVDATFGSYAGLAHSDAHRFAWVPRNQREKELAGGL